MRQPKSQQGVALLTILIMVVLATILATSIFKAQQNALDETKLLLRQDQALLYAQSAEFFFSELLVQDAKDNKVDHLAENWAQPFPLFPVQDGAISGQIFDEQRKFNINSLLKEDGSVNDAAVQFLKNILVRSELDPQLVEGFIDWQDADEETIGAMGAENSYYRGLKDGFLAANDRFTSVQQLQWVRGMTPEAYVRLAPYVTALPDRLSKMNLNTLDPFLLSCLTENLNPMSVQNTVLQKRNNLEYFNDLDELWELEPFSSVSTEQRAIFKDLFSGQSQYFTAEIVVNLSERRRVMSSHLYRQGEVVQAYQRSWVLLSEQ